MGGGPPNGNRLLNRPGRQPSLFEFAGRLSFTQGLKDYDMAAMNGTIKRLVSDKGFGFILADDGNEYFFHNSACTGIRFDELREGQAVSFERGQGPKGPRAENVRVS